MFHGPAFQTVAALDTLGNPGGTGRLTVRARDRLFASLPEPLLLTDPCVLDGVGQVVGLWAKMYGLCILPIGVAKVEFYGPPPAPDTTIPIRIEVIEVNHDAITMRCHIELGDGRGSVWARLAGWADFIMPCSSQYINATDLPFQYPWAQELDLPGAPAGSVCTLLKREDFKGVNLEWTSRLFLHARELAEYQALENPARRRQFLASRAAAKDAIRLWWSRQHGMDRLAHPSTLVIDHDEAGRPRLGPDAEPELPGLSIAHTESGAVALAADVPVGIDLEPTARDTHALLPSFATTQERALLERTDGRPDFASTRLWCAKEAVAKVLGTGLQGRLKDFEAVEVEANGDFLIHHGPTGERMVAHTAQVGSFIVAWAVGPEGPLASGDDFQRLARRKEGRTDVEQPSAR
jgi:phosphopantetheinyl transferase